MGRGYIFYIFRAFPKIKNGIWKKSSTFKLMVSSTLPSIISLTFITTETGKSRYWHPCDKARPQEPRTMTVLPYVAPLGAHSQQTSEWLLLCGHYSGQREDRNLSLAEIMSCRERQTQAAGKERSQSWNR